MCVACRERGDKSAFVRIGAKEFGFAEPAECASVAQTHGVKAGRGAYIHRDAKCVKIAVKKRSFDRALRRKVPDEVYKELEDMVSNEQ